eukprot:XP_001707040.1 Hypothetical protein GL50803_19401 [Giardia lamblia ATCC 50803]
MSVEERRTTNHQGQSDPNTMKRIDTGCSCAQVSIGWSHRRSPEKLGLKVRLTGEPRSASPDLPRLHASGTGSWLTCAILGPRMQVWAQQKNAGNNWLLPVLCLWTSKIPLVNP